MRIEHVTVYHVRMPLQHAFVTSTGGRSERDALILEVREASGAVGWGECVAGLEPRYSEETVHTAWAVLEHFLLPVLLERDWAHRAGVGFVGRNACLIVPGLGSWVFLGVLLVPERLEPDPEPLLLDEAPPRWRFADGAVGTCGRCARCLDVCPTGAFPAPYVVDARRCISYLTIEHRGPIPHELRPHMGNWIFGCDLCQDVCPWNERFAVPTDEPAFQPRPDQVAPPLLDLLRLDDAAFRARYRKTPLYRARRRGLLRNVCVAIGNWGDPQAVPALAEVLAREPEPLVRGHAAWALGRIGTAGAREALLAAWAREEDGDVREEVERALARWGQPSL